MAITLYTTTGCPLCDRYRKLLDQKNQTYTEKNTTENPKYLDELSAKQIFTVPTVMVGSEVIEGFRPNSLLELI
ncbi:MAG: glutaredoxin family protein [Actinomycetota bacterium]